MRRRLDRKYAHLVEQGALRKSLMLIREGLANSASDFLLERFSYADITMAVVLEVIAPVARSVPPLGVETNKCWNNLQLAEEFKDLTEWRNRLAQSKNYSYSQFDHE